MGSIYGPAFTMLVTATVSTVWNSVVSQAVPDPYLDEVFHVRQAQVYCAGDFQTWDPKITTPPGLYLVSYLLFLITGRCDIGALRLSNVASLSLIAVECYFLLDLCSSKYDIGNQDSWKLIHTAINISFFPPLFFFSALYYTDLQSLLLVLLTIHLSIVRLEVDSWMLIPVQVLLGDASLAFRQTNIFWVAIFPAGLIVLDLCERYKSRPLLVIGWLDDYVRVVLDLAITSLENLPSLFFNCLPLLGILGLFAAFVAVNGGVVLGDKSNHVATIHVPQMLYIWPYMTFFSFPVVLQTLSLGPAHQPTFSRLARQVPRAWILLVVLSIALGSVHYNTIVHPFTLADNRHYVFYVFRILRQHWSLKYVATLVYVLLAWACIQAVVTFKLDKKAGQKSNVDSNTPTQSRVKLGILIVWFVTSSLSLITAPLVEPRYFIIPWVLWRIFLSLNTQSKTSLGVETVWYGLINLVTGYMFLYRPFFWKQEPGQLQRFMW